MPSDALTVAVTTGLGVSVLAGILSGICYILTHGLPNTRIRKAITPWHCNVCGGQFRSIQGILEVEKVVTCAKCKTKVCRVRCSKRDPQRGWICQICQQPENWFKGLLKSIHPNKDWNTNRMDSDAIDELDEDLMELRKKEREQVRDFIERLVESMLGGDLDDVSVSRIYNDKKYDSLFTRYHSQLSNALTDLGSALHISISNLPITGQSPCSAHAFLKQLIQNFSGEAAELPSLKRSQDHPAHPEETLSNRTYEDLLSTAIINKVVQANQSEARSSANSGRTSIKTKTSDDKEYFFGEETLENKWRNHDSIRDDDSSASSLDEWVRSDSSTGFSKYVDRVSLTIKQHIEEGTSSEDETLEAESHAQENSLLSTVDDTWHENWYFQKRRLTDSSSPVPVPMLVPNPITDAKVFIGDKEAEEISDIDSDYGDPEVVPNIKNILVNSKTIIGGKNAINTVEETFDEFYLGDNNRSKTIDAEVTPDVIINEYPVNIHGVQNDNENALQITKSHNEDTSLTSIESNTEQDTEYTEQYASLTRTFLESSASMLRNTQTTEGYNEEAIKMFESGFEVNAQNNRKDRTNEDITDSDDEEKSKIFKGSYSEREKEKWKHSSVEIPDNPYSAKNLERRLSSRSSSSSSSSRFGRDYYIKNAAKSAGARTATKLAIESEMLDCSSTNGNENNFKEAVTLLTTPVVDGPEDSNEFESTSESPNLILTRPSNHEISSDSDLSIERVYNLQSGKMFEKKGKVKQEIPVDNSHTPEGLKYTFKEFDEDVRSFQTDENHNNTVTNNKIAFMRSLTQNDNETNDECEKSKIFVEADKTIQKEEIVISEENEISNQIDKSDIPNIQPEKNIKTNETGQLNEVIVGQSNEIIEEDRTELNLLNSASITQIPKSFGEAKRIIDKINTSDYSEEEILSDNLEFSLEYSTDINEDDISKTESLLETDPEIIDLKEKRLVKDVLGKFSKSYPNLLTIPTKKMEDQAEINNIVQETEELEILQPSESTESILEDKLERVASVKNLKQFFDKENTTSNITKNPQQIYSLTARSLPREFRQKLKSDDETSLQNETVTDANIINEETSELLPMDITKNMIAFYENLEHKNKHT